MPHRFLGTNKLTRAGAASKLLSSWDGAGPMPPSAPDEDGERIASSSPQIGFFKRGLGPGYTERSGRDELELGLKSGPSNDGIIPRCEAEAQS